MYSVIVIIVICFAAQVESFMFTSGDPASFWLLSILISLLAVGAYWAGLKRYARGKNDSRPGD